MPETRQQSYSSHTRWDPLFHFAVMPVVVINLIATIVQVIRFPTLGNGWIVVLSMAAAVAVLKMRMYSLKAQDRVIRLEERLRLATVLEEPLRSRIGELSEPQLIALRFASDAELQALVQQSLSSKLRPAEIKKAIVAWRSDFFRV